MTMTRLGRVLGRNIMLILGLVLVLGMSLAALFAPLLAPFDPNELHLDDILLAPCATYPLGTDRLGRDVLSRLLYGGQVSLWVGFVAVGISISIGTALGLVSGYFRGIADEIIMRGVDVMLCFPSFFLILAVVAFLEPSLTNIMVVIGLTSWMGIARLVRAETLSLRERDFVSAARLSGAGLCERCQAFGCVNEEHIASPHIAQCPGACDHYGHSGDRRSHSHGIWPELPWPWGAAAPGELGEHADGGQGSH